MELFESMMLKHRKLNESGLKSITVEFSDTGMSSAPVKDATYSVSTPAEAVQEFLKDNPKYNSTAIIQIYDEDGNAWYIDEEDNNNIKAFDNLDEFLDIKPDINLSLDASGQSVGFLGGKGGTVENEAVYQEDLPEDISEIAIAIDPDSDLDYSEEGEDGNIIYYFISPDLTEDEFISAAKVLGFEDTHSPTEILWEKSDGTQIEFYDDSRFGDPEDPIGNGFTIYGAKKVEESVKVNESKKITEDFSQGTPEWVVKGLTDKYYGPELKKYMTKYGFDLNKDNFVEVDNLSPTSSILKDPDKFVLIQIGRALYSPSIDSSSYKGPYVGQGRAQRVASKRSLNYILDNEAERIGYFEKSGDDLAQLRADRKNAKKDLVQRGSGQYYSKYYPAGWKTPEGQDKSGYPLPDPWKYEDMLNAAGLDNYAEKLDMWHRKIKETRDLLLDELSEVDDYGDTEASNASNVGKGLQSLSTAIKLYKSAQNIVSKIIGKLNNSEITKEDAEKRIRGLFKDAGRSILSYLEYARGHSDAYLAGVSHSFDYPYGYFESLKVNESKKITESISWKDAGIDGKYFEIYLPTFYNSAKSTLRVYVNENEDDPDGDAPYRLDVGFNDDENRMTGLIDDFKLIEALKSEGYTSVRGFEGFSHLTDEEVEDISEDIKDYFVNVSQDELDKVVYDLLDEYDQEKFARKGLGNSDLSEDTVKKKNGKWTNRGDDGKEHGEFNTKKEADAQRKAMFANGYKAESKKRVMKEASDYPTDNEILALAKKIDPNCERDFKSDEEYAFLFGSPETTDKEFSEVLKGLGFKKVSGHYSLPVLAYTNGRVTVEYYDGYVDPIAYGYDEDDEIDTRNGFTIYVDDDESMTESVKLREGYGIEITTQDLMEISDRIGELVEMMDDTGLGSIKGDPNTYGIGAPFIGTYNGYIDLSNIEKYVGISDEEEDEYGEW